MVSVRSPHQAGHDVELARSRRVVARVGADFERRRAIVGNGAIVAQRQCDEIVERAKRCRCRNRIGGIGRNKQRGFVGAPQCALKAARNFDCEQHFARSQDAVELGLVAHLPRNLEIFGVFQRLEDRAPDVTRLLQQHSRRQTARMA
jgi:hypothetical protein